MNNYWPDADKLRTHLADNMLKRGEITFENHKSNAYCGMDMYRVKYRGIVWEITYVDGMACWLTKHKDMHNSCQ